MQKILFKFILVFLSLVISTSLRSQPSPNALYRFPDVPAGFYAEEAIDIAVLSGFMEGKSDGTFGLYPYRHRLAVIIAQRLSFFGREVALGNLSETETYEYLQALKLDFLDYQAYLESDSICNNPDPKTVDYTIALCEDYVKKWLQSHYDSNFPLLGNDLPPPPIAQRKALVIGNSNYQQAPLANPQNDARAMSAALQRLGFQVATHYDLNFPRMRAAVRDFRATLRTGDIALVYFSGHGAEVNGENYLIPTDAYFASPEVVEDEALALSKVLESLGNSPAQLNIIILDACRNNPFKGSNKSFSDGGLAEVSVSVYRDFIPQTREAQGVLISFATAPKALAADGDGDHSPYTAALLQSIGTPNMTMEEMFKDVRELVVQNTGGRQRPWENSTVIGDFYFVPQP